MFCSTGHPSSSTCTIPMLMRNENNPLLSHRGSFGLLPRLLDRRWFAISSYHRIPQRCCVAVGLMVANRADIVCFHDSSPFEAIRLMIDRITHLEHLGLAPGVNTALRCIYIALAHLTLNKHLFRSSRQSVSCELLDSMALLQRQSSKALIKCLFVFCSPIEYH